MSLHYARIKPYSQREEKDKCCEARILHHEKIEKEGLYIVDISKQKKRNTFCNECGYPRGSELGIFVLSNNKCIVNQFIDISILDIDESPIESSHETLT